MNVFVTGAAGFLGRHLCRALRVRGDFVVGLVRDDVRDPDPFDVDAAVRGDVSSCLLLERVLAEYEIGVVHHLAAQAQVSVAKADPVGTLEANVAGTWNVLEACRRQKIARVVIASSDKAFGDAEAPYWDSTLVRASGLYATSKAMADLVAESYAREFDLPVAVTRMGNIYGPGHRNFSTLIPGTIRSVLRGERPILRSDGTQRRDYLFIEDAVAGYLALGSSDRCGGFNFGTSWPTPAVAVVLDILRLMGSDLAPDIRATSRGEIHEQWLDSSRAKKDLGWEARTPLEEGLKRTIPWYKANFRG